MDIVTALDGQRIIASGSMLVSQREKLVEITIETTTIILAPDFSSGTFAADPKGITRAPAVGVGLNGISEFTANHQKGWVGRAALRLALDGLEKWGVLTWTILDA